MHAILIIQCFFKDTLGVLGFKNFVAQDPVLKLNLRLSFYHRYPVAEMAGNKPCGVNMNI